MSSILVVDDNDMNLRLLKDILVAHNYTVHTASSGEEALQHAYAHTPDLILLDVQMPGMSGTQVMQILKGDPSWRQVPILAVTALAMQGDEAQLLEAGFDGYISKPLSFRDMLGTVGRSLAESP